MPDDGLKLNRRELLWTSGSALSLIICPRMAFAESSSATEKKTSPTTDFNPDLLYRNESPLGISSELRAQLGADCAKDPFHFYKYLSDQTSMLKKQISEKIQVTEDFLYLSPGAGPTLEKILHTIRDEKAHLAISDPDFYFLTRVAEHLKIKMRLVPTDAEFAVDLPGLAKTKAEYIYFSNPHVPYGKAKSKTEIAGFLKSVDKNTIVVIDEAYREFSPRAEEISAMSLVKDHKNLVVVRTFSKIYGLAALRVGYFATQNKKFSEYFTIYTVSAFSAKAAQGALADQANFDRTFKYVSDARKKVVAAAKQAGLKNIESEANFVTLLTTAEQKDAVVFSLKKLNYYLASSQENRFLRLTLSTEAALDDALKAVSDSMKTEK